jgi:FAD/FMN-containing dehydrogenase
MTLTLSEKSTLIPTLKKKIKGDVLTDEYSLGMYSTDASIYQITPVAIVLPKDERDVRIAIELARKHAVTILPRGGGTSLAGQTVGKLILIP